MTASSQFGLPLDSSNLEISRTGKNKVVLTLYITHGTMYMIDWMMFIAATVSDNTVRDGLISNLHDYASSNLENQPFEVVYNPLSGHQINGSAR